MKNVGVICGGFSSEFDISVKSATNIVNNFPDEYKAFLVYLKKEGWFVDVNGDEVSLDAKNFSFITAEGEQSIDFAIVYVHGDPGENGKVQAYLEMIDIPYVNSGPLASQLSFDKWYCNQFIKGFGFKVAESIYLASIDEVPSVDEIINQLGLPVFVKPCDSGSSYGIARVNSGVEMMPAIKAAFEEGETIVLEAFLDGVEVTCGVYRTLEGVEALPLTEIVSENEFFDFEAKYKGLSDEITPARISSELTSIVQETSKRLYQLLNLHSIARIDYMLVNDVPHIIEVNTTPGFSNESIVPKMIEADGLTVKEFWGKILRAELS